MGLGSSPIRQTSPVTGKLLCLQGDGNHDIGPPQPLAFPATMVTKQSVRAMTEAQFFTAITAKGANYTYPLLTRPQVTAAAEIM